MQLLEGSKIQVDQSSYDTTLIIPYGAPNISRYLTGLFLLFFIYLWFLSFGHLSDEATKKGAGGFHVFGLVVWIVCGIFLPYYLYRIFRPSIGESITLQSTSIKYDSGIPPFQMDFGKNNLVEAWRMWYPKRTRIELTRSQIETLSLTETPTGNRLTVDVGAKRIEIAVGASDIEREWLYGTLKEKYL